MTRLAWIFLAVGASAVAIGPIGPAGGRFARVASLETDRPAIQGEGAFLPEATYPTTGPLGLPVAVETRGSWLGSDAFEGSYLTGWFRPAANPIIYLAGYPASPLNRIEIEVRTARGGSQTIRFAGANPGEAWQPWNIALPPGATGFRIHAVDGSNIAGGWLAFSEPILTRYGTPADVWPFIQLLATAVLALVLLWGPGLLWFTSRPRPSSDLALAAFIGPLMLTAVGLACWLLGGHWPPASVARVGVVGILAGLGWFLAVKGGRRAAVPHEMAAALGTAALLAGFAAAKADLSYAAPGELFWGTVSRTLEVGGHSDSRIPYHTVQMVAHHLAPFAPETRNYFYPWSFASRGPLAGLLAAPIVLAVGADVPLGMPAQSWEPFDRQGFATYRIAMIALAAVASWAVYGVAFELVGGGWALLAASIALFAPFFVHELYFTWPKLAAAAGVLVSFLLVRRSRALAAGVFLGVAYLFHPSAILAAPFLAACVLADRSSAWQRPGFRWAAAYAAGLLVVVLAWQSVRLLSPVKQLGQEGFLDYFRLADNRLATPDTWLRTRWDNLTNTFVPFRLLFTDQTHESINSYYGPSDGWVHFGFLYWNTLPFALGLGAFFVLAPALALGIWRRPAAAGVFVLGPAALLVVYWGCACTGLMRHTGHWFFFSTILFSVWSLRQCGGRLRSWPVAIMTHPAWIAARGLDVGWMAFGTALHGHWPRPGSPFFANDWIALGLAATLLSAAAALLASALAPVGRAILERAPAGAAAPVT